MSRAGAKGGAKRRKNKRGGGGGSGDHKAISGVAMGNAPEAAGIGMPGATMATNRPARATECGARATSGSHLETFNVGDTQRSPLAPTVDNCVLCRTERKDTSSLESGIEAAKKLGVFPAPLGSTVPYQTLWLCLHCQWTLEKLRAYGSLDQSVLGPDILGQCPLSESQEEAGGGRLPLPCEIPRSFEVCKEPREASPDTDPESLQLQNYWAEVRYLVRCIYRHAGSTTAASVPDREWVKELVDRLCRSDPSQLYQRLDQQARDYLLEMKINLLQHLAASSRAPSCLQNPLQAYQFVSLLLKEYGIFCQAARTISSFLVTLENKHLNVFQVTWELHNKHLFENLIFSEPLLQCNLPALVSQVRLGTKMQDACSRELYITLLQQYQHLEEEMHSVAREWLDCQKRVSVYIKEKVRMKTKLAKDFKHFKQRQSHEKQIPGRRVGTAETLSDAMRHVLASPDGRYDPSHSHILISSVMEPPGPGNARVRQPPHQMGSPAPDRHPESHLPGVPIAGLGAVSGSPIPIHQQPIFIHPGHVSTPPVCGDDDMAALSARFANICPLGTDGAEEADKRAEARGDPGGLFLSSSILTVPACYTPHYEGQGGGGGVKKGGHDPQKEGREKSADKDSFSEHSSNTSTSSCACTCTYAGQREGKYCDYCCEFFRHNWPSAAPKSRNYEGMREKLRFRLAKRKEEQSKKTDQLSEQESVVDNRTVEDLLQFINSSDTKPASSTRAAKRARHKQKKLEEKTRLEAEARARAREQEHLREEQMLQEQQRQQEQRRQLEQRQREAMKEQRPEDFQQLQKLQAVRKKEKPRKDAPRLDMPHGNIRSAAKHVPVSAPLHSGSPEQTGEPEATSHLPSRFAAHPGSGARGDSKFVLTKEVSGKQPEPFSFLLDPAHHHKEAAAKQKPKQAWKASSEPTMRPAQFSSASAVQPRPHTQAEPKSKVLDLPAMSEQQRKEKRVTRGGNKKQLDQAKSGKASSGPTEHTCPTKHVHHGKQPFADTPQPRGKGKKNQKKKGDGDGDRYDSSIEDIFMPKDIDLDNVDMDETEREVEYFKRFCLDSTKQARQRMTMDWSDFSFKKRPFFPHH